MSPLFSHLLFAIFISTTLEAYQLPRFRPLHIHYPLSQEDPQELLKRIQNHQIAEIRVADDLKSVISIPNPLPPSADPLFEQSHPIFDNTNLRNMNLDVNQNGETYHTTKVNPFLLPKIIDASLENSVQTTFLQESFVSHFLHHPFGTLYENAFPLFVGGVFLRRFIQFWQRGQNPQTPFGGGRGNLFPGAGNSGNPFFGGGFEESSQPMILSNTKNTSLSDWAGSPEIFYECYEIISYLQNASEFQAVGAEVPRGILLEGPPGTGKTLLARAIASEVNASFISVVGSQFVEMFVGVGALRIRELFQTARENLPCVLFIDEIDAIGKKRGGGASGFSGNDEREQTLNQLLAEMDGFQDNEGLLVIAATNLKDSLDTALTRPGRFDRILSVPLPDTPSREKILHKYLDSKPVDTSNISIEEFAELTAGFSGADLKNLVNEALIHMIRRRNLEKTHPHYLSNFFSKHVAVHMSDNFIDKPSIAILKQEDVNQALEKILIGIVKQNDTRSIDIQRRVALHELGHAIMVATHSDEFDLQKISIQNTYSGIGGFTLFRPKQEITEGGLYTKQFLEKRLQIMLGGRAAEEIFYGRRFVSLGATKDLEEANSLAKQMVEQYGMGSNETNVYFRVRDDSGLIGGGFGGAIDTLSEHTKSKLEKESYDLVACAYQKTLDKIRHYEIKLDKLSLVLLMERVFYGNPFC
jgi:cell division protease FtsH